MKQIINYVQLAEMSHEQKKAMYSKLTKPELIEMLIEANKHLIYLSEVYNQIPNKKTTEGMPW